MNRKILEWPHPILKKVAPAAVMEDTFTNEVIQDLKDTFRIVQGYGLAAPQIGHSLRAIVISPRALGIGDEEELLMINPTLSLGDDITTSQEACFSVPDIVATVRRRETCSVEYQNAQGETCTAELSGLPAFCVQHEIDHLDGKTTLDVVGRMTKSRLLKKREKLLNEKRKIEEEYRREFEADQELYISDESSRPARVSKVSAKRKKMQKLSRKINYHKKKRKK